LVKENHPVRIAVVGAGAFGSNHLRVLKELPPAALIAAVEPDSTRADGVARQFSIPVFPSLDAALCADLALEAAIVAVPTLHHGHVASQLLAAGIDCLVEKPLAASLDEADQMIALADRHQRILQPGHLERFNPAVLTMQQDLRGPMFFEAHRLSIFTPRSLDVDVVLDLMIHDLDVVLRFADSHVRELRAVGLPILSGKVDIANVRVEFESGCVANFTASRVSTERVRKLRYFEPGRYVSIDYARRDALVIGVDHHFDLASAMRAGAAEDFTNGLPGLHFEKPAIAAGEPLRLELESFLHSVRTRQQPPMTGHQGREALALALAIQQQMADHARVAGLHS
jgi:predicted dehydrogenase